MPPCLHPNYEHLFERVKRMVGKVRLQRHHPPPQPDQRLGEVQDAQTRPGSLRVLRSVADAQQIPHQRALEVDHTVPRNQGGFDGLSNL